MCVYVLGGRDCNLRPAMRYEQVTSAGIWDDYKQVATGVYLQFYVRLCHASVAWKVFCAEQSRSTY